MQFDDSCDRRRQVVFGLMLVALGAAFLLDRFDLIDLAGNWHYWFLAMVLVGLNRAIGARSARDLTGGLWSAATGLVLFATFEGLFGLTLWNAVPLFIIMSGVSIALRPLAARRFQHNKEASHEAR